ncbi:MAG: hypothetical protein HUJ61_06665 [Bacilli bacterium]|nr:hypothetical protein [Bacilli bacterium]
MTKGVFLLTALLAGFTYIGDSCLTVQQIDNTFFDISRKCTYDCLDITDEYIPYINKEKYEDNVRQEMKTKLSKYKVSDYELIMSFYNKDNSENLDCADGVTITLNAHVRNIINFSKTYKHEIQERGLI